MSACFFDTVGVGRRKRRKNSDVGRVTGTGFWWSGTVIKKDDGLMCDKGLAE